MNDAIWTYSGAVASELEKSREFVEHVVQQLKNREGWGEKSANNLFQAIEDKWSKLQAKVDVNNQVKEIGGMITAKNVIRTKFQ